MLDLVTGLMLVLCSNKLAHPRFSVLPAKLTGFLA